MGRCFKERVFQGGESSHFLSNTDDRSSQIGKRELLTKEKLLVILTGEMSVDGGHRSPTGVS